jgi:hypothetical protein
VSVIVVFVRVRDDLDSSVRHPARREQAVGYALQLVAPSPQNDDFETAPRVEVHVQR